MKAARTIENIRLHSIKEETPDYYAIWCRRVGRVVLASIFIALPVLFWQEAATSHKTPASQSMLLDYAPASSRGEILIYHNNGLPRP